MRSRMKLSHDGKTLCCILDSDIKNGEFIIPDSVTTIGESVFFACDNLNHIIVDDIFYDRMRSLFHDYQDKVVKKSFYNEILGVRNDAFNLLRNKLKTSKLYMSGVNKGLIGDVHSVIDEFEGSLRKRFDDYISGVTNPKTAEQLHSYKSKVNQLKDDLVKQVVAESMEYIIEKIEKYKDILEKKKTEVQVKKPRLFTDNPTKSQEIEAKLNCIEKLIRHLQNHSESLKIKMTSYNTYRLIYMILLDFSTKYR